MDKCESLLRRAAACGWEIRLGEDGPRLVTTGEQREVPSRLLADLKANRNAIVEHLRKQQEDFEQQCAVCKCWWFEPLTAELAQRFCLVAATPGKAYTDIDGERHKQTQGCQYKDGAS